MSLDVRHLTPGDAGRWDRFVETCPEGTFFHRAGWRTVLERAFGHRTYYLYAEGPEGVRGVLPLVRVRSRLFGDHLSSVPFCAYGGAAVADPEAEAVLLKAACDLAADLGVDDLELRGLVRRRPEWPVKDLYVTFRKAMDPDPETNLKAIPRKQRAMVRKGIQAGLQGELDGGVERLYRVYSESLRNLGTPVFARGYLALLRETFAGDCDVLMIQHEGRDVAGVMSFYFRDQVLPYYGGSRPEARDLKANDFMYWDLMCRAVDRGLRVFDYGRSKVGSGSYSFKKNWGFEPEPLHYEYFLVRAGEMPQLNPNNPKYRLLIDAWRRLPLPVANRLGPLVAKYLG